MGPLQRPSSTDAGRKLARGRVERQVRPQPCLCPTIYFCGRTRARGTHVRGGRTCRTCIILQRILFPQAGLADLRLSLGIAIFFKSTAYGHFLEKLRIRLVEDSKQRPRHTTLMICNFSVCLIAM